MAKINFPTGEVWHTFQLETGLITPPILKLKLKPSFKKDLIESTLQKVDLSAERVQKGELSKEEMLLSFKSSVTYAMNHVTGWDLEDGKGPIPCTDKNKAEYLDKLLWENIEDKKKYEKPEDKIKAAVWLWSAILKFIGDVNNFTKN